MSNMVNIKVPTDPTDQSDLLVCLNGQRYLIQRGRPWRYLGGWPK